MKAWQVHCRDIFLEASRAKVAVPDRRLMWAASMARLVSASTASSYIPASTFDRSARIAMLEGFLASLKPRHVRHAERRLELPFDQIADLSHTILSTGRPLLLRRLRSLFPCSRRNGNRPNHVEQARHIRNRVISGQDLNISVARHRKLPISINRPNNHERERTEGNTGRKQ